MISVTRRSRTDAVHLLSVSWLALTWLMWPWWVMIPKDALEVTLLTESLYVSSDLTDVTLVSEDALTYVTMVSEDPF